MSFYRTLLASVVAMALAAPVFAADDSMNMQNNPADNSMQSTSPTSQQQQQPGNENRVNLNTASAKELMKVKGLNAAKARAIVAYRKKHGDFKSVDEITKVRGFSRLKPDQLQKIQNQLIIQ